MRTLNYNLNRHIKHNTVKLKVNLTVSSHVGIQENQWHRQLYSCLTSALYGLVNATPLRIYAWEKAATVQRMRGWKGFKGGLDI